MVGPLIALVPRLSSQAPERATPDVAPPSEGKPTVTSYWEHNLPLQRMVGTGTSLVLVADDYPGVAELLAEAIEMTLSCRTVRVLNGQEALDQALHLRPTACVLDVDMPKLTGIQVAGELRMRLGSATPLLVAVTGKADEAAARSGMFDVVLRKPVDFDALTVVLRRVVSDRPT